MSDLNKLRDKASQKTILYIDSDKALQKNFGIYLNKTFKSLYQAYDGLDGLKQFKAKKPDIIVTDLELDNLDAIEMIVDIQDCSDDVIIITVSKSCENYDLLQTLDMGLDAMILKPISFAQLIIKMLEILPEPPKPKIIPKKEIQKPKSVEKKVEKEIEKPVEKKPEVKTIITKEVKKETIKTKEPIQSCIDDIKKLITNKSEVVFINAYKGITIQNKGELLNCIANTLKVKATIPQLIALKYEKHTVIEVNKSNSYILADLVNIDLKTSMATLQSPRYIEYKERDKLSSRILSDKSFKASIYHNNIHIDFTTTFISYGSAVFYIKELDFSMQVGTTFDVTLGFELNSPSSMIKEKKFTKIFSKGKVLRIDSLSHGMNIVVALDIQKSGQSTFRKYLQQREMEIIHELKKRLRV